MTARPQRPWPLRALAFGHRTVHQITGGRFGSNEAGKAAPRGRTLQVIAALHLRAYRWTNGIIGGNVAGLSTLLLTTTGRKTGLARTAPLPYFPHADGVVVVASYAGGPKNPAWYDNLVANPDVQVQIKARRYRATATTAGPEERTAIWAAVVAAAPNYGDYEAITRRDIPVVILRAV